MTTELEGCCLGAITFGCQDDVEGLDLSSGMSGGGWDGTNVIRTICFSTDRGSGLLGPGLLLAEESGGDMTNGEFGDDDE
jgi:hypothetical protein